MILIYITFDDEKHKLIKLTQSLLAPKQLAIGNGFLNIIEIIFP